MFFLDFVESQRDQWERTVDVTEGETVIGNIITLDDRLSSEIRQDVEVERWK